MWSREESRGFKGILSGTIPRRGSAGEFLGMAAAPSFVHDVYGLSERRLHGFQEPLAHGGVRVDGLREVVQEGPHFDGERGFRNQLAGIGAHDLDAEDALGLGVGNGLHEAVRCVEREGSPDALKGKLPEQP